MILSVGVNGFAILSPDGGWGPKGPSTREGKREEKMDKIYAEMGLSEEQLQLIKANREATKDAKKALGEQLKAKREALGQALNAPETDRAQIDALVGEFSALQTQKIQDHVNHTLEIKEILTLEQFAELSAKKESMKKGLKESWKRKWSHSNQQ